MRSAATIPSRTPPERLPRSTAAFLALIVLAAGAGSTRADPASKDKPVLSTGPVLAGRSVFWGESTYEKMIVLVRSPRAGPVIVYRRTSTPNKQDWAADDIAAS